MDKTKRIDDLIYYLQGARKSLEEACEDLNIDSSSLSIEELSELDSSIFLCDDCGWWYDCSERAYIDEFGNTCIYCADGLEEE